MCRRGEQYKKAARSGHERLLHRADGSPTQSEGVGEQEVR